MLLTIFFLILPLGILASKSWYHWQYLREVDHTYSAYATSHEFSRRMHNPFNQSIGGIGMGPNRRFYNSFNLSGYIMSPFFSKRSAYKHSAMANFYAKVIYWHLAAFYMVSASIIAVWVWR